MGSSRGEDECVAALRPGVVVGARVWFPWERRPARAPEV